MPLRDITLSEWEAYHWIASDVGGGRIWARGVKKTQTPDDGFVYVECTERGGIEQKWTRAKTFDDTPEPVLEAGRAVDDLIAALVMRWAKVLEPYHRVGKFPDNMKVAYHWRCPDGSIVGGLGHDDEWLPSTEIADAFEAESKIFEDGNAIEYIHHLKNIVVGDEGLTTVNDWCYFYHLIHATPLQRCKAMLKAVCNV